jgi:hypothetical protein
MKGWLDERWGAQRDWHDPSAPLPSHIPRPSPRIHVGTYQADANCSNFTAHSGGRDFKTPADQHPSGSRRNDRDNRCHAQALRSYTDRHGEEQQYSSWSHDAENRCYDGAVILPPGATNIKVWIENVGLGKATRVCAVDRSVPELPWKHGMHGEVFEIQEGDDDVELVIRVRGPVYHSFIDLAADVARHPSKSVPHWERWPTTAEVRKPNPTQYDCFRVYESDAENKTPGERFQRAVQHYLDRVGDIVKELDILGQTSRTLRRVLRVLKGVCVLGAAGAAACVWFPPAAIVSAFVTTLSFLSIGLTSLFDYVTKSDLRVRVANALTEQRELLFAGGKHAGHADPTTPLIVAVLRGLTSATAVGAKATRAVVTALQLSTAGAVTDRSSIQAARLFASAVTVNQAAQATQVCGTIVTVCAGLSVVINLVDLGYTLATDHPMQQPIHSARAHFDADLERLRTAQLQYAIGAALAADEQ